MPGGLPPLALCHDDKIKVLGRQGFRPLADDASMVIIGAPTTRLAVASELEQGQKIASLAFVSSSME